MKRFFVLTLSAVALVLLASAPAAQAGVYYQAETSVQSSAGAKGDHIVVEAWVEGDNAKILFKESSNPLTTEGSYLLTRDGGKTVLLVNPKEKSYTEMDLTQLLGSLGAMRDAMGGVVDIEFSQPEVEILGEEEGDEILGIPTRRFQLRSHYGVTIKVLGIKQASDTEVMQELWVAEGWDDAAVGMWLRKQPPSTGDAEFDALLAAEANKVQGLPLLSRSVTTTISGRKGKRKSTTTTTTEVTKLERMTVESSEFELPAGYQKTELVEESAFGPFGVGPKGKKEN